QSLRNIDVEVHKSNARLRLAMAACGAPWPVMRLQVAYVGQVKAAPRTTARQTAGAAAGELKDQYGLAAVFRVSENMRAGGARVVAIHAGNRAARANRFPYGSIGRARHLSLNADRPSPCGSRRDS